MGSSALSGIVAITDQHRVCMCVCASHSLLYCKASSVSNEEVTLELQAVTTSQKVRFSENKLLPSVRTLTSNPACGCVFHRQSTLT